MFAFNTSLNTSVDMNTDNEIQNKPIDNDN